MEKSSIQICLNSEFDSVSESNSDTPSESFLLKIGVELRFLRFLWYNNDIKINTVNMYAQSEICQRRILPHI